MTWIPVGERLPELYQRVVVYFIPSPHDPEEVREQRRISTATRINMQQFGNNQVAYGWCTDGPCKRFGQEVTHWQPLPEPPGKEGA